MCKSNWMNTPKVRGESKKCLKPRPSQKPINNTAESYQPTNLWCHLLIYPWNFVESENQTSWANDYHNFINQQQHILWEHSTHLPALFRFLWCFVMNRLQLEKQQWWTHTIAPERFQRPQTGCNDRCDNLLKTLLILISWMFSLGGLVGSAWSDLEKWRLRKATR